MSDDGTGRTLTSLGTSGGRNVTMASLADDCLALLPADGVSITLLSAGSAVAAAASLNGTGIAAHDVELTLGEGPGVDAYASGLPVVVADVDATDGRWPEYVRAVEPTGVQAVYAFPLRLGAATFGVLTLYRHRPHTPTDPELATIFAVANALANAIIGLQACADVGVLADALHDGANLRAVVHQATGALAVQLDCSVEDALVRLRSAAFAADRSLSDIAADVVAGRLRIGA